LEEILRAYLSERTAQEVLYNRPTHRLLFPAEDGGMRRDIRGLLDRLGERTGWKPGEMRAKMFRYTYCAARLQTLDHGASVGPYTVARELGHGSTAMVEKAYSHLGTLRHRSEVVEYRVEQHVAALGDRLDALNNVTQNVTQLQNNAAA
jgi:integrase